MFWGAFWCVKMLMFHRLYEEKVLCSGFWCVKMLIFYFILKRENVLCSGFWCVKLLIFYWFYKGKCNLGWILVCSNAVFSSYNRWKINILTHQTPRQNTFPFYQTNRKSTFWHTRIHYRKHVPLYKPPESNT